MNWRGRARKQATTVRVDRHKKPKILPKTSQIQLAFDPNVPWCVMLKMVGLLGRSEGPHLSLRVSRGAQCRSAFPRTSSFGRK
jgi:hypothetical protein